MRYAHTNIVADDWRQLATFYQRVFRCEPTGPERDLSQPWLARATAVKGAALRGVHLRLPGHGSRGPTLEIFEYSEAPPRPQPPRANRPGFGHLAFEVDDVEQTQRDVIAAGGGSLGEITSAEIPKAGVITFVYVTDPEGNIIELQTWRPQA